jgi:heme exporter protein D
MTRLTPSAPRDPDGNGRRDPAGWLSVVAAYVSFVVILLVVFTWHRAAVLDNHARMLQAVARIERLAADNARLIRELAEVDAGPRPQPKASPSPDTSPDSSPPAPRGGTPGGGD